MVALAEAAGISRDTLSGIERGHNFGRTTLTRVERELEAREHDAGLAAPLPTVALGEPHIVVRRLKNHLGEAVVEGPVEDLPALEAAVVQLLRGLSDGR